MPHSFMNHAIDPPSPRQILSGLLLQFFGLCITTACTTVTAHETRRPTPTTAVFNIMVQRDGEQDFIKKELASRYVSQENLRERTLSKVIAKFSKFRGKLSLFLKENVIFMPMSQDWHRRYSRICGTCSRRSNHSSTELQRRQ